MSELSNPAGRLRGNPTLSRPKALEEAGLTIDGVEVLRGFIERGPIDGLCSELAPLFASPILNRRRNSSIWLQHGVKVAALPTALRSLNLLEVSIEIRDLVARKLDSDLIITNLEVMSDTAQKAVFWHTDGRVGMVRAMLYVKGGASESGAFWYALGSHRVDHDIDHDLNAAEIATMQDTMVQCSGQPGDLVLFDSSGFHSKGNCCDERVVGMCECQPRGSIHPKATIDINTASLSPRVAARIDLFAVDGCGETYGQHGIDLFVRNDWSSLGLMRAVAAELIPLWIRSKFYKLRLRLLASVPGRQRGS